jgi:hypothetical protein
MPEPTFLVRVVDYLQAVLGQWLTVILLALSLLRLAPLLLPSSGRFVEWVQRNRRAFLALILGVFVIANFRVFDQDQRDLRALRISSTSIADNAERARRTALLAKLRQEYILSHDGITPQMAAGSEPPPGDWTNERLRQCGESWRVPQ